MSSIQSLVNLCKAVAAAPQLTQGGGGNTSVKEGSQMWIKASGFRLDEVSPTNGYVEVNYLPIVTYLKNSEGNEWADADLKEFVNNQIQGDRSILPSMETGFHAVLKRFVIHTHPVVVNQLMCCEEGEAMLTEIFKNENYAIIPFVNPGYYLSKAVANLGDSMPQIIFLQNHGLIIHADTEEEAIQLHEKVINLLPKNELNPVFELLKIHENSFELKSPILDLLFENPSLLLNTYFPDQAVVIGNNFNYSHENNTDVKLSFVGITKQCFIHAPYKNALAIAENLLAFAQIVHYSHAHHLTLAPLPIADVAYLLGMDMEKYRQGLLK